MMMSAGSGGKPVDNLLNVCIVFVFFSFTSRQVGKTNRDNEDLAWLRETSPTTNREDVVNSSVDLMMVSDSFSVLLVGNAIAFATVSGRWKLVMMNR